MKISTLFEKTRNVVIRWAGFLGSSSSGAHAGSIKVLYRVVVIRNTSPAAVSMMVVELVVLSFT